VYMWSCDEDVVMTFKKFKRHGSCIPLIQREHR
jgi:hypothetical protein